MGLVFRQLMFPFSFFLVVVVVQSQDIHVQLNPEKNIENDLSTSSIVNLQITMKNSSTGMEHLSHCSGNIIHPSFILTSAHCLHHQGSILKEVRISAGDHYSENYDDNTKQVSQSDEVIIHGRFNPDNLQNDIALIRMKFAFKMTKHVQLVSISDLTNAETTEAMTAGWGSLSKPSSSPSNELRMENVRIINNSKCSNKYENVSRVEIASSMICTEALLDSRSKTCHNEFAGGLLFCKDANREEYLLCGSSSFGVADQCGSEYPLVYTGYRPFFLGFKVMSPMSGITMREMEQLVYIQVLRAY